jgi:hypothetical protein
LQCKPSCLSICSIKDFFLHIRNCHRRESRTTSDHTPILLFGAKSTPPHNGVRTGPSGWSPGSARDGVVLGASRRVRRRSGVVEMVVTVCVPPLGEAPQGAPGIA